MRLVWILFIAVAFLGCEKSVAKDAPKQSAASGEATKTKAKAPLTEPGKHAQKAPAKYVVKLNTTKGDILIDVTREWSPNGADRFYSLVKAGYYDDVAFFRVIAGFMGQVGINGDPKVNTAWRQAKIKDDKNFGAIGNSRGFVTFAKTGAPNSRTTQFFINLGENRNLDKMGFTPFGKVRDMKIMDSIYSGYGEGAPRGRGPAQHRAQAEGNAYFRKDFPELDYIKTATIVTK